MKSLLLVSLLQFVLLFCQASLVTFEWQEGLELDELELTFWAFDGSHQSAISTAIYQVGRGNTYLSVHLQVPSSLCQLVGRKKEPLSSRVYRNTFPLILCDDLQRQRVILLFRPVDEVQEGLSTNPCEIYEAQNSEMPSSAQSQEK